jgi:hypothetical protein
MATQILQEHQPTPLDPEVDAWIRERFASTLVR